LWFGGRGGRLGLKGARAVIRPGLFSPVVLLTPARGDCWGGELWSPVSACAWFARFGGLYPSHRNESPLEGVED
jgi:hypothetical protein